MIISYLSCILSSNYFTLDAASPITFKYSSILAGIDNALGVQDAANAEPSSITATDPLQLQELYLIKYHLVKILIIHHFRNKL